MGSIRRYNALKNQAQQQVTSAFSKSDRTETRELKSPSHDAAVVVEEQTQKPSDKPEPSQMVQQTTAGADTYYVDVKLGPHEVVALVDTGAMVTTTSAEVFHGCAELEAILQPCMSHVMGMGGQAIDVLEEIYIPLDLGQFHLSHNEL